MLVIKQIGFPFAVVRLCLSRVCLQTELDSTQSYYHYFKVVTFCVITLCVRKVITICVERLLHFASMLLHFALVLHFAAILITFCGDYYILRRSSRLENIIS